MNQSFYFADTVWQIYIYWIVCYLYLMQYVNVMRLSGWLFTFRRSDVRTKRHAARSDPAPASGYLTPHPDLQNKILSAFYANGLGGGSSQQQGIVGSVGFLSLLFAVAALKVVRHRRTQTENFSFLLKTATDLLKMFWMIDLTLTHVGAARPLLTSERLTWTNSEGWGFYFGGFAAMQWC